MAGSARPFGKRAGFIGRVGKQPVMNVEQFPALIHRIQDQAAQYGTERVQAVLGATPFEIRFPWSRVRAALTRPL